MPSTKGTVNVTNSSTTILARDAAAKQTILSNNGIEDVWLHLGDSPAVDNQGTKLSAAGNSGDRIQLEGGMAQSSIFGIVGTTTTAVAFSRITDL